MALFHSNGEDGFGAAVARDHNRLAHALNGNIDFCAGEAEAGYSIGARCQALAWDCPAIEADERTDFGIALQESETFQQRKVYTDGFTPGLSSPAGGGTLHSVIYTGIDEPDVVGQLLTQRLITQQLSKYCGDQNKYRVAKEKFDATVEAIRRDSSLGEAERTRAIAALQVPLVPMGQCECVAARLSSARRVLGYHRNAEGAITAEGNIMVRELLRCEGELGRRDRMYWVAVRGVKDRNHGRLEATDLLEDYVTGIEAPNARSGLLNGLRDAAAWRRLSGCPLLMAASKRALQSGRADWRALGLVVALYDDARETRFTQPTGQEGACANRQRIGRQLVRSSAWGEAWGYQAVFINNHALEFALSGEGALPVRFNGVDTEWSLTDPDVITIWVNDNDTESDRGKEIRCLMRVKIDRVRGDISYRTWPTDAPLTTYAYRVESNGVSDYW